MVNPPMSAFTWSLSSRSKEFDDFFEKVRQEVKELADNTLVALTLMIVESKSEDKDVMVEVEDLTLENSTDQLTTDDGGSGYFADSLEQRLTFTS